MAQSKDSVLVTSSTAHATSVEDTYALPARPSVWQRLGSTARSQPVGVFGLFLTLVVVVIVIFGPYLATHEPDAETTNLLASPSGENWFGTDLKGRDYFSRTLAGGRITVAIAVLSLALGTIAGTLIGMVSAYVKFLDLLLQRLIDSGAPRPLPHPPFTPCSGRTSRFSSTCLPVRNAPPRAHCARPPSPPDEPYVGQRRWWVLRGFASCCACAAKSRQPWAPSSSRRRDLMLVNRGTGFLGLGAQAAPVRGGAKWSRTAASTSPPSHLFIFPQSDCPRGARGEPPRRLTAGPLDPRCGELDSTGATVRPGVERQRPPESGRPLQCAESIRRYASFQRRAKLKVSPAGTGSA